MAIYLTLGQCDERLFQGDRRTADAELQPAELRDAVLHEALGLIHRAAVETALDQRAFLCAERVLPETKAGEQV